VVRVPEDAPDPEGEPGVPEPGVVAAGDVFIPVHPAVIIAPHRKIVIIAHVLTCISERASLSYIMFVLHHQIPVYTIISLPTDMEDAGSSPRNKTEISRFSDGKMMMVTKSGIRKKKF
jgi:hypothetical protein